MRGQVKMMVVSMKVCFERGLGTKVTRLKKKRSHSGTNTVMCVL